MAPQLPILDVRSRITDRRGFTLIELLTVVIIIGILAAIVFTSMGKVRQAAKDSKCLSNLRQIQSANLLHAADNRGVFVRIKNGDGWWFVQRDFYNYLDAKQATSTSSRSMLDDLKCPTIEFLERSNSTWEKENFPGYGYFSFGFNNLEYVTDPVTGKKTRQYKFPNQNNLTTPSRTMAFADALDFHIYSTPPASYDWQHESKRTATISYRHQEGTCVVYYDGHAERLARAEVEPASKHPDLWGKNN